MFTRFSAAIAGAAMILTSVTAQPASADEDVVKVIAAIAGLAILGKVVKDRNDDRTVTRGTPIPTYSDRIKPRPVPDQVRRGSRKLLPGNCLQSVKSRHGQSVQMFGQSCLRNNYQHVGRLPQECAVRVRGRNGIHRGYEARCLRHEGYKLAHR